MENNNIYSKTNKFIKQKQYFLENMNFVYRCLYEMTLRGQALCMFFRHLISPEDDQLNIMAIGVEEYFDNKFPMRKEDVYFPDPLEVILRSQEIK